ncbi:hypothetical protein ASE00_02905 [Sphingomonas sp. Root710]|nr:hypothetical protein ASE00_02905 [Sphingomonas sp. Root710]
METEIQWAPLLLFLSALTAFAAIAYLRRRRPAGKQRGFRNMQSPAARARKRAQRRVSSGPSQHP